MFGFGKKQQINEKSPQDVRKDLGTGKICLVDVREQAEWDAQHIPGALLIPLSKLPQQIADLKKDKPVVFHCRSGARSAQAIAVAKKLGLPHDTHMSGGIIAWQQAGFPVKP